MAKPSIVIVGGPPDQLHQITKLAVPDWIVSIFPTGHLPTQADIGPLPGLALLFLEDPADENLSLLRSLQENLPAIPVVLIAENPTRDDIIRALRLGVKDYLLFPLQAEDIRLALDKYRKKEPFSPSPLSFKGWKAKFRHWLGIEPLQEKNSRRGRNMKKESGIQLKDFFRPAATEEQPKSGVAVQFLGGFRIWVKGKELPVLPGEKINAFFAYLLYHHKKTVHREILLDKFWEYTSSSCARKSLNVTMHRLRCHFNEYLPDMEFLQYYNDNYSINPELNIVTDVDQFLGHWHKGRALEASHGLGKALEDYRLATGLYKGDFLAGIHYEDWCEQERDNLKETYLILLDRLGSYFLQEASYGLAEKVFRKMLEKDPCLENIHRKLILCYYWLGRRDKAIRQYYKCEEVLQKELNVESSISTKEIFQLIIAEKDIPRMV